jgi:hypothetical protein
MLTLLHSVSAVMEQTNFAIVKTASLTALAAPDVRKRSAAARCMPLSLAKRRPPNSALRWWR